MVANRLIESGIMRGVQHPFAHNMCSLRLRRLPKNPRLRHRPLASAGTATPEDSEFNRMNTQSESSLSNSTPRAYDTEALPENFCIIESRESVRDFAKLQLEEISQNISARRNKIFLLMEEVRRLRIQERIKGGERSKEEELGDERYPSALPLLPPLTDATINVYFQFYATACAIIIIFGGLLSPVLEVRLGIGGTSYEQFIGSMHLPAQLAQVDPIVASFCGGAVGVLSTLLLVEVNNAKLQAKTRCVYCEGCGYVTCGACSGEGAIPVAPGTAASTASSASSGAAAGEGTKVPLISQTSNGPVMVAGERCGSCSGTGKVMCIACLCTGKKVAREHDIRLDPFF